MWRLICTQGKIGSAKIAGKATTPDIDDGLIIEFEIGGKGIGLISAIAFEGAEVDESFFAHCILNRFIVGIGCRDDINK